MEVPDDQPDVCAVCGRPYDSISEHDAGVMVNLLDNERYRRVCFEPRAGGRLWFYHHTHEQTAAADAGTAGPRMGSPVDARSE